MRLINKLSYQFQKDKEYAQLYTRFIEEYEALGHMKAVSINQPEPTINFYLPHHGVWKESSATTKLRVVFNDSSKTDSGFSLNDLLYTGPKLQTELFDVLIWFRQFRHVFMSDIEKMYRQIAVHPDHWKYQRILWKINSNNIVTYQLTIITYGLACAPFLALRALLQLIEDEGGKFPSAIPTLTRGRYVNDVFGDADSVEEAQVHQLCMAGGFRLQKWTTNSHGVLNAIPADLQLQTSEIAINEDFIVHSLGLSWQPTTDNFLFSSQVINTENITKRSVLSTIAKLFDPLGLLSPVLVTAKIIMQELWTLKLDWDDPIPTSIANKWCLFVHNLQNLSTLTFPRWLGCTTERSLELHGFADASHHAFAAVIYIRSSASDGRVVN